MEGWRRGRRDHDMARRAWHKMVSWRSKQALYRDGGFGGICMHRALALWQFVASKHISSFTVEGRK